MGLDRVSQDPFDEVENPGGIIQLGLSENRVLSSVSVTKSGRVMIHLQSIGM